jgi:hypothetical protein
VSSSEIAAGVEFTLGSYWFDYPRRLLIDVSTDNDRWHEVWQGEGGESDCRGAHGPTPRPDAA